MLACARLAASCCSRTASRSAHQTHAQACLSLRQPLAITAPAAPSREKTKFVPPVLAWPSAFVHPAFRCLFFLQAVCSLRHLPGDAPRSRRNASLRRLWLFCDRNYVHSKNRRLESILTRSGTTALQWTGNENAGEGGPGEGAPSPGFLPGDTAFEQPNMVMNPNPILRFYNHDATWKMSHN